MIVHSDGSGKINVFTLQEVGHNPRKLCLLTRSNTGIWCKYYNIKHGILAGTYAFNRFVCFVYYIHIHSVWCAVTCFFAIFFGVFVKEKTPFPFGQKFICLFITYFFKVQLATKKKKKKKKESKKDFSRFFSVFIFWGENMFLVNQ